MDCILCECDDLGNYYVNFVEKYRFLCYDELHFDINCFMFKAQGGYITAVWKEDFSNVSKFETVSSNKEKRIGWDTLNDSF